MNRIHYENPMQEPEVVAVCANCTREDCDGVCDDYRNAARKCLGLPPLRRLNYRAKYEFDGESHTLREWSEISGIHCNVLYRRLNSGMTIGEALSRPVRVKNRAVIEHDGQAYTLAEWAEALGVSYMTLYMRLRRGMTIAQAAAQQPPRRAQTITVDGQTMTVGRWAKRMGVSRGTIYARMRRGCSPEEAVTMGRMT